MDRHNRGDIREKGEKTTQGGVNQLEREFIQIRQQREWNKWKHEMWQECRPRMMYSHIQWWWCEQSWWCRRGLHSCSPAGRSPCKTPTRDSSEHRTCTLHASAPICLRTRIRATLEAEIHSSVQVVYTCCFISTQTCWHRQNAKAFLRGQGVPHPPKESFLFGSNPSL